MCNKHTQKKILC